MSIEQSNCIRRFTRLCTDGYEQGWHEANGGNLSYRMSEEDISVCMPYLSHLGHPWMTLDVTVENLAGSFLIVTGAGKYLRKVSIDLHQNIGIVEINEAGTGYRVVWGFTDGTQPTSEFPSHLLVHSANLAQGKVEDRVVYHAHAPQIVTLTNVLPAEGRAITRALWKTMSEAILVFPEGIGVLGFYSPGTTDIAYATAKLIPDHHCIVWAQHGAILTMPTFDEAFGMMQTLEKAAGTYNTARAMCGGAEPAFGLSDDQLRLVCSSYGIAPNEAYLDA